jgi:hypothetical protein
MATALQAAVISRMYEVKLPGKPMLVSFVVFFFTKCCAKARLAQAQVLSLVVILLP